MQKIKYQYNIIYFVLFIIASFPTPSLAERGTSPSNSPVLDSAMNEFVRVQTKDGVFYEGILLSYDNATISLRLKNDSIIIINRSEIVTINLAQSQVGSSDLTGRSENESSYQNQSTRLSNRQFGLKIGLGTVELDLERKSFYAYISSSFMVPIIAREFGSIGGGAANVLSFSFGAGGMFRLGNDWKFQIMGNFSPIFDVGGSFASFAFGVEIGFQYTNRESGLTMAFKLPMFGFTYNSYPSAPSIASGMNQVGFILYYPYTWVSSSLFSIGYRF